MTFKHLIVLLLSLSLISCGGGGSSDEKKTPPPPASNQPPTAHAGEDKTVDEQNTVIISGSGTDSDGTISSYTWTQTSGESVILSNSSTDTLTFDSPITTTEIALIFELKVTDDDGATASDSIDIKVSPVNLVPVVDAGEDVTVKELVDVALSSTSIDDDGEITTYLWEQISGELVDLFDTDKATANFKAPITDTDIELIFLITVTDNEGAEQSDTISIFIQDIEIQQVIIDTPSTIPETANISLLSSTSGTSELYGDRGTLIERDNDELLMVLDDQERIILLKITDSESDEQAISTDSTAFSLIAFQPIFGDYSIEKIKSIQADIEALPEFTTLSNTIDTTINWSDFQNSDIVEAYAVALVKAEEIIKSKLTTSNSLESPYQDKKSKKNMDSGGSSTKAIGSPSLDDWSKTLTSGKGKDENGNVLSGITIGLSGEKSSTSEPEFTLSIDNALHRFVYMVVGTKKHNYGKRSFLMNSNSTKNHVESYLNKLIKENPDEGGAYVYAYGPGEGQLLEWIDDENKYFNEASIASLIKYYFIPAGSKLFGTPEACLKNIFFNLEPNGDDSENSYSVLKNDFSLKMISEAGTELNNGDYSKATVILFSQLSIHYRTNILECVKETLESEIEGAITEVLEETISLMTKRSLGLLGELYKVYEHLDALGSVDDRFLKAISSAPKSDYWLITNEHVNNPENVSITSPNSIKLPTVASLASEYDYQFDETCHDDEECKYFVYKRGEDFKVDFDAKCKNWGDKEECSHFIIDFGDNNQIGGTKDAPSQPYISTKQEHVYLTTDEKATYNLTMSVMDFDGAYADYKIKLQLEEAIPEMSVFVDGEPYEIGENTIFNCESNEIISKTLTIINGGLGDLFLREKGAESDGNGWESYVLDGVQTLSWSKQIDIAITNDCSDINDDIKWGNTYFDTELDHIKQIINFTVDPFLPPVAYYASLSVSFDEQLEEQLQADDETGFRIVTQPIYGTVDLNVQDGTFTYTPEQNITQDTIDSFTFVATNDSAGISDGGTGIPGESNEATINIEITADPIYANFIGTWDLYFDMWIYSELEPDGANWSASNTCITAQEGNEENGIIHNLYIYNHPDRQVVLNADGSGSYKFYNWQDGFGPCDRILDNTGERSLSWNVTNGVFKINFSSDAVKSFSGGISEIADTYDDYEFFWKDIFYSEQYGRRARMYRVTSP
jgi:hypothetical protein